MEFPSCLRSGFCCKQATCAVGLAYGAPPVGCTFLKGDAPGDYSCEIAEQHPELHEGMAIGAGCSSTLFNTDREIAKETLKASAPPADTSVGGQNEANRTGHDVRELDNRGTAGDAQGASAPASPARIQQGPADADSAAGSDGAAVPADAAQPRH